MFLIELKQMFIDVRGACRHLKSPPITTETNNVFFLCERCIPKKVQKTQKSEKTIFSDFFESDNALS